MYLPSKEPVCDWGVSHSGVKECHSIRSLQDLLVAEKP